MTLEQELALSLSPFDEQAKQNVFHKIYDKYFKLVWFCAYRFLGNKEDTDEISDDVFVKFYFGADKAEIQNIKFYLTRSARNRSTVCAAKNRRKNLTNARWGSTLFRKART